MCVCVTRYHCRQNMTLQSNLPKLKIAILGSAQVGKSAIVVRYLTRRYISEYCSQNDFLYRHAMYLDDNLQVEVDILDTSGRLESEHLLEHIAWANAFVVVYSINDQCSFLYASDLLETISVLKQTCPIILLANKTDLSDHARLVSTTSGQELAATYDCLPIDFFEVTAAESYFEIIRAFRWLIRNSKSMLEQQRTMSSMRTKTSPSLKVSRMFERMLEKMGKNGPKKKQKSLSI